MDGLQAQFDGNRLDCIDLPEQLHRFLGQAIRPGADGKSYDIVRGDGLQIPPTQGLNGGIGIGKRLEISDIFAAFALGFNTFFRLFQLLRDAAPLFGEFSAAVAGTENAAAVAQCAIPVGTGEACVDGQLIDLATKFFQIVVTKLPVHGVAPFSFSPHRGSR